MKGSLGSLCEKHIMSMVTKETQKEARKTETNTHWPLPKTLPYPAWRVSITGTISEVSVRPSFCAEGTSVQSLSTLMMGRHWRLRVRWKQSITTLPK